MRPVLAAVALVVILAGTAHAADIRVDAAGGGAHTTITAALEAANSGDVLLIASGTYTEDLVLGDGRILTLQGDDPETTIIAGTGLTSVVKIGTGGNGITLRALTVTGGDTSGNGGCLLITEANPTLEDVIAHGCTAARGGCVALSEADPDMTNVVLHSCHAVGVLDPEELEDGLGGGLYAVDSSPELVGLHVWGNEADVMGGGLMFFQGGFPSLEESWVHGNFGPFGAGVVIWAEPELTMNRVAVTDNTHCEGGGVMGFQAGLLTISQSVVARNAVDLAGACDSYDGEGAGIYAREDMVLALSASVVAANNAGPAGGGGILVRSSGSAATIERTIIKLNSADYGAGVLAHEDASGITLDRCRISNNIAGTLGGGARLEVSEAEVKGALFDANDGADWGGDLSIESTAAEPGVHVHHSLFLGSEATQGGSILAEGRGVSLTSNTIYQADPSASSSGALHLAEIAAMGMEGTFSSNIVAASDGAWDLYADTMTGSLDFPVTWSVLDGGTAGTLGGAMSVHVPEQTLEDAPAFESVDIADGWGTFFRLSPGSPGLNDGNPTLGNDPDGSGPDRGAFGGAGASVWDNGDLDGDGVTVWEGDCNDDDPLVNPDATEICNCRDDNCDLLVDDVKGCISTGFCWAPSPGDDDDDDDDTTAGDDDDTTAGDDDDDDDDDDATAGDDDDDSSGFDPAAGCLVTCDASSGGGAPFWWLGLLATLTGWRRRRAVASSAHD